MHIKPAPQDSPIKHVTLRIVGGSYMLCLPRALQRLLGWTDKTYLDVTTRGDRLVARKSPTPRPVRQPEPLAQARGDDE